MVKYVTEKLNQKPSSFDLVEDIFNVLRFRGNIFFNSKLAVPWGLALDKLNSPRFHINLQGNFFIGTTDDEQTIEVMQGDIVMLPHGNSHWIADQVNRELIPSTKAGEACQLNQPLFQHGEINNKLICGIVNFDKHVSHPILDALPNMLHFSEFTPSDPIWMTVQIIDSELQRSCVNKTSLIDRLTEVLFLQLLNKYLNENKELQGFFAALQDSRVHHALSLIHSQPEQAWTLEMLGNQVGMSRSTLQRQFKDTVGVSPMTYLSNWRLLRAHYLVKHSCLLIEDIAEQTGFANARTLNKAFTRHFQYSPAALRKIKKDE